MAHTITITRLPDEDSDDYEYEFGGEHDHTCMVGEACGRKACQVMDPDRGTERTRHGREHWYADGTWWVERTRGCALDHVFELEYPDAKLAQAGLGTYPVEIDWDGDQWWLTVLHDRAVTPLNVEAA